MFRKDTSIMNFMDGVRNEITTSMIDRIACYENVLKLCAKNYFSYRSITYESCSSFLSRPKTPR